MIPRSTQRAAGAGVCGRERGARLQVAGTLADALDKSDVHLRKQNQPLTEATGITDVALGPNCEITQPLARKYFPQRPAAISIRPSR